ncbi:MAG: circularly permuted type 2 ATP-grasp protein [Bacteroidota bacterium]
MPSRAHTAHHRSALQHYHDLILRDLRAADEQLEQLVQLQRERHVTFGDRVMAHSLRPTFLTEATYNEVQDTVYLIRQALLTIAAHVFNDEHVVQEGLGLDPWEIELAAIPTNVVRLSALSRMDSFLTKDSFKFVELNGESPAGIAYLHELAEIYRSLPIFQTFQRTFPVRFISPMQHTFSALLHIYHEQFDGREERPSFAIVDYLDTPTIHEFKLLKAYFERMGCPCEVVDPRDLDCQDGWIYANGRKIDILYRRLLLNEFYERRDECQAFLEGYRAQKTCYLNTFRTKLVHKKAVFSFLSDERYTSRLSREQQEAVRAHIPWTRMLRQEHTTFRGLKIDLVEFVRNNRSYFVVKPNDEYGGKGVTLGFASTQSEWDAAIQYAVQGPTRFVVQEVVDIHREPFLMKTDGSWDMVPTIIDLDPYLNGPLMGGCLTRTSASNLANVTAGGGTLPMFILRHSYHYE